MDFNSYQRNTIKLCAKEVARYTEKNNRLEAQIEALRKEQEENNQKIEELSAPIKEMTGGFSPLELVHRVVNDKNIANWVFIYPETIIPIANTTTPSTEQAAPVGSEPSTAQPDENSKPIEQEQPTIEGRTAQPSNENANTAASPESETAAPHDPIDDVF